MTAIKNEVMIRVRRLFLVRKLAAPFVFLAVSMVVVASTVSISHVIANMPKADIQALARFVAVAFAHTDVVVKCALVAGIAFLFMTLRGIIASVRLSNSPERI
jgi:hypothetical protein